MASERDTRDVVLEQVELKQKRLTDYRSIVSGKVIAKIEELAALFKGERKWCRRKIFNE